MIRVLSEMSIIMIIMDNIPIITPQAIMYMASVISHSPESREYRHALLFRWHLTRAIYTFPRRSKLKGKRLEDVCV